MNKLLLGGALLLAACGSTTTEKEVKETPQEDPKEQVAASNPEVSWFGEEFKLEHAPSADYIYSEIEGHDSLEIAVSAEIIDVCQKKGCWMNVKMTDSTQMMVRFKDYAFFMPMDCAGQAVTFKGLAYRDTVSVADLQHYAEDANASEEEIAAITEPEISITFEASGVMLWNK